MTDTLPCLNPRCGKAVHPEEARTYAGVYVCEACFALVSRFEERAAKDLQKLLLVLREGLRVSLLEGRFECREAQEEPSMSGALRTVFRLLEGQNDRDRDRTGAGNPANQPRSGRRDGEHVRRMGR